MKITVILLLVFYISIFNIRNSKAFVFSLIISFVGILGCIILSTTFAWFNESKEIFVDPIRSGTFSTNISLSLNDNQIDTSSDITLERGKKYDIIITNVGNVSGQAKILFGDKEYYTDIISPNMSVIIKFVPPTSGIIKFEDDWKTNNSPTVFDDVEDKDCKYDGELKQGAEYVTEQYTYRYMQEGKGTYSSLSWQNISIDGWGVLLTDKKSTDDVTEEICNTINGKPIVSAAYMFYGSAAKNINLDNFDTSNITNMVGMFYNSKAESLNVSNFNTSKVTNMGRMFNGNYSTELDLINFNTSNVTDMSYMFANSRVKKLDLRCFDTTNVIKYGYMFMGCAADGWVYTNSQSAANKFSNSGNLPNEFSDTPNNLYFTYNEEIVKNSCKK